MSKQTPLANEIVSLTVMLLMFAALVAAQADARLLATNSSAKPAVAVLAQDAPQPAPKARIRANLELEPITLTIDATADIGHLLRRAN